MNMCRFCRLAEPDGRTTIRGRVYVALLLHLEEFSRYGLDYTISCASLISNAINNSRRKNIMILGTLLLVASAIYVFDLFRPDTFDYFYDYDQQELRHKSEPSIWNRL